MSGDMHKSSNGVAAVAAKGLQIAGYTVSHHQPQRNG
jgi:hypothetical protein